MDYTDINGKPINLDKKVKQHIKKLKDENNEKTEKIMNQKTLK